MKESVYVKEKPDMGCGIFAARDISKDKIILEFKGPRIRILVKK